MIQEFNLQGKQVLITGGSGVLGEKHAEVICDLGGSPIISDIENESTQNLVNKLQNKYNTGIGLVADISDEEDMKRAIKSILGKVNRIDVLINNAALTARGMAERAADFFECFEDYKYDAWKEMINVNLTGHFIVSKLVGKLMIQQRSGVIINIASEIGLIGPDQRIYRGIKNPYNDGPLSSPPSYPLTKAGVIYLTKYLDACWGKYNVRINTLCPGGVFDNHEKKFVKNYSNLVPLARMAQKDEYKGAIAFLATDASSFMTGSTLVVDGGKTCW